MGIANQDAMKQFQLLINEVDGSLKNSFENMHQGHPEETLERFLKARDWNVAKAHKMLIDCLHWRIQNEIDNILSKPIIPPELYRAVRDSQLVGLSGYSKEGLPVIAVGVGQSTFDKASVHYYVQSHIQMNEYRDRVVLPAATKKQGRHISTCLKVLDMTGLKLSALNQIKLLTVISTIDDLNYPEKTDTYYIVNVPYVFSACWKVVKPLLQERTRRKIQVLQNCGRDELLKVMDYASLPHFCRKERSGSSRHSENGTTENCFSYDSAFHQQLYNYIHQQGAVREPIVPIKQGSFHVDFPEPDPRDVEIAKTIETEFHKMENHNNALSYSMNGLKVNGD
ncbi:phosphatidylinositol/phosphatidylcholine transfer protein SFH1-like isoform X1 [Cucurbita pepo subsp. pepo]|uniref:Phosphatidylinositol/phosphatidylcholine transfer protein SFH1-like n=1 Tax=Cucurbita maxima TaxID=3661 RepID=A0A6J1KZ89_CUCMA|nr:phosphatidylinositol/phosphatidylcholine transfer protein SFH1-like [Cucurbita maxima]XP_023540489.1 phosphatidylinositol/phosphatidylcholine transfer protein SFH1-like isoform X1 [Cucurbita pepo subsp. pepo]